MVNRESLNWWLTLTANLAVLGGLVFVGYEVRQNTSQLRAESSWSITESVNATNSAIYSDSELSKIVIQGKADLRSLDNVERMRFDRYQFSRLNIAETVLDLEHEGVSDLNFRYVDWIVREFNEEPGLRAFIREYKDGYVGSEELLSRLLGADPSNQ
jgi:hypothetical protein